MNQWHSCYYIFIIAEKCSKKHHHKIKRKQTVWNEFDGQYKDKKGQYNDMLRCNFMI